MKQSINTLESMSRAPEVCSVLFPEICWSTPCTSNPLLSSSNSGGGRNHRSYQTISNFHR